MNLPFASLQDAADNGPADEITTRITIIRASRIRSSIALAPSLAELGRSGYTLIVISIGG